MVEPVEHIVWLAFAGLLTAMIALTALLQEERGKARHRARLARAAGRHGQAAALAGPGGGTGRAQLAARMRRMAAMIGERVSAILGGEAKTTAEELSSAGYRGRDALLIYAFLKTVLPTGTLLVGVPFVLLTAVPGQGLLIPLATVVAAALAISKGVDIVVDLKRKSRLARIRLAFPDMLELLVITSEAGLGPQPALHRVARELGAAHPELAAEMLQMVAEMRMTNDRATAYGKLATRVPLPEVGVFTQTLDQSDKYGTPFSRAMRTLIEQSRADRLMRIEEKAARLPVIMTVPLIFCIMPAVFVVLVGPAVLSVFDNIIAGGM